MNDCKKKWLVLCRNFICLALMTGLASSLFAQEAEDTEEWVEIPVKFNVLDKVDFTAQDAQDVVTEANKQLAQARVKLIFGEKHFIYYQH